MKNSDRLGLLAESCGSSWMENKIENQFFQGGYHLSLIVITFCNSTCVPIVLCTLELKFWCNKYSARDIRDDGQYICRRVFDLISN